ncbi:MAG: rhomboid family intramembrane serine protease [Candidatus Aenigmarchaeota archaeon]|nr:rhomboid family intramembrane serine protease [Candidatus Aenigmarchaeota archaeon]
MKITLLLAAAVTASFFASTILDVDAERFGFSGENFLRHPEVLVTSIFLHGNLEHLLSNILVLVFAGIAVEGELGRGKMLAIFFLGAFAGDLLSLIFYPFNSVSIGASGGIFALLGAGMLVRPLDISIYPLAVPVPLAFLGILYAFYNAYGFLTDSTSNISYMAHFGGLALGLVWGLAEKGLRKGAKIILISAAIMLLLPALFFVLKRGFV